MFLFLKSFASFFLLFVESQSCYYFYITILQYLKLFRNVNKEFFRNVNKGRINFNTDYLFMKIKIKIKIKDDLLFIFYEMKASKN